MKHINMVKFAEVTGYNYELIRDIAKAHGSWKAIVEHVKLKSKIDPEMAFKGFIYNEECIKFCRKHINILKSESYIQVDREAELNYETNIDYAVYKRILAAFNITNSRHISLTRHCVVISQFTTSDSFSHWYTYIIWLIIKDIGDKLNTILKGG